MLNMVMPKKPSVALLLPPVLVSFVAFILALIALLAGTGPQQESLEPYHIIAINMSAFGQDLIASQNPSGPKPPKQGEGGLLGSIVGGANEISQDITNGLNSLTDDAADKIIGKLGISEWYSLHIMTTCEGVFSPNVSSSNAWFNMTKCTAPQPGVNLNLSSLVDHEVKAGPFHLNANKIPIPDAVQDAINLVNSALLALLVFYALASGLSGLSFLAGLAVLIFLRKRLTKRIVWANVVVAALGAFILLIGSATVTYLNNKGVPELDHAGKDIGISGIRGSKFIILSWATFGLMLFTSLYWSLATLKFTQKWIIMDDGSIHDGEKGLSHSTFSF
ncbi:actin cortical patch SUR7/pH-response regulator pali [Xylaria nigripes]|nr:actin cortical patch SUR7/pH-response regulator pali [Xylaria nigripes]